MYNIFQINLVILKKNLTCRIISFKAVLKNSGDASVTKEN